MARSKPESSKESDTNSRTEMTKQQWPSLNDFRDTWHTTTPFLITLMNDLRQFNTLFNFESLVVELQSIFESEGDDMCDCVEARREEETLQDSPWCLEGKWDLHGREFLLLERWISRMNQTVADLMMIRDRMVAEASSTRKNTERSLAFLNDKELQRALEKFPSDFEFELVDRDRCDSPLTESPSSADEDKSGLGHSEQNISQLGALVQALPPEILHAIILHAQASDPHLHITLAQVDRFFRTFVNTSPLLWSTLDLSYPLPLTELSLQRSSDAQLDILADDWLYHSRSPVLRQKEISKALAFFDLLRPHQQRIRRLKIECSTSVCWDGPVPNNTSPPTSSALLNHFLWGSQFGSLDSLDLRFETWEPMEPINIPLFGDLRELRLYGPWPSSMLSLISPNLRHLSLGLQRSVYADKLVEVLSITSALESLTISDLMPRHTPTESYGAVEIGSLQRLCIIRSPPSIVTLLMGMIGVPNLEQLSVHFSGEVDPTSTRTFWNLLPVNVTAIQLLGTPHPRIRRLDLISCEAEPSFLRDTLDNLPALEWLRIASSALTDKHLEALVVVPFDPDLVRCSRLASISIENEPAVTSTGIARIARSRHETSMPLRHVALRGFDVTHIFLDDLESIRSSGVIDLAVTTFGGEEGIGSEHNSDWSESWSENDDESDGETASGDEDISAQ